MLQVRVKIRPDTLPKALRAMGDEAREFVMRGALNKSMDRVYTVAKREIAKRANIRVGEIAAGMRKRPASGGSLVARVTNTNRFFPGGYPQFTPRQTSRGASFSPWKDQREHVTGGFLATMKSGHHSIFKRVRKSRLPIADVGWGPNPAKEMVREDHGYVVVPEIHKVASATFNAEFTRLYGVMVAKIKGRYGL